MTGRSQDASVFSTCHGKFLLTATVGLVIFCFTATTTAVCYICVTLPSMQFARLLRCIYLLGCRRFLALYWSDNTGNVSLFKKDRNHFWSSSSNISGSNTCLASVTISGQNCRDQPRQYRATETKTLYFNLEKISSQTWLFIYLFFFTRKKDSYFARREFVLVTAILKTVRTGASYAGAWVWKILGKRMELHS